MRTFAERLRDKLLEREILLERMLKHELKRALKLLDNLHHTYEAQLAARVRRIEALGLDPGPTTTAHLLGALRDLEGLLDDGYVDLGSRLRRGFADLPAMESEAVERILASSVPSRELADTLAFFRPPELILQSILDNPPFKGSLLNARWKRLSKVHQELFETAVHTGTLAGESIPKIVRRITNQGFAQSRRHVTTVVRSAVSHITQTAREETLKANAGPTGVVKGLQWLSTLDLRTTAEYCVPRDHKVYNALTLEPVGHDLPWKEGPGRLHYGCRSSMTAVLKSWKELGVPANEISGATRASMDGQVAESLDLKTWLKRRKISDIERVFGKERARLFKAGELSARDMVHADGGLLTLEELKEAA